MSGAPLSKLDLIEQLNAQRTFWKAQIATQIVRIGVYVNGSLVGEVKQDADHAVTPTPEGTLWLDAGAAISTYYAAKLADVEAQLTALDVDINA